MNNIAEVYGLITNRHFEILDSTFEGKFSRDGGVKTVGAELIAKPAISDEKRAKNVPQIEKTLMKYKTLQAIFSQREKFFLRNAIDYYVRSLKDDLLEEKLLDLMICIEALFNNENDELSYRYSLRVSSLLGIGQEDKKPEIFDNMRKFYKHRSAIVHGVEKPNLTFNDALVLQKYAIEAINCFTNIDMCKQDFVLLLDKSLVDSNQAKLLKTKVTEAISKW